MLNKVVIKKPGTVAPGSPVVFQLKPNPAEECNGYIKDITGLTPVKANINFTEMAALPGSQFQGSNQGNRNIVITLEPQPDWVNNLGFEGVRRMISKKLRNGSQMELIFYDSVLPPKRIFGYVESVEPTLFSKDPHIQISIVCVDIYFTPLSGNIVVPMTGWTLGGTSVIFEAENVGDVPTGVIFNFTNMNDATSLGLRNLATDALVTYGPVVDGDALALSTVKGSKYCRRTRAGSTSNRLTDLNQIDTWHEMDVDILSRFRVTNLFKSMAGGTMSFLPKYESVF